MKKPRKLVRIVLFLCILAIVVEAGFRALDYYGVFPETAEFLLSWHQEGHVKGLAERAAYIGYRPSADSGQLNSLGFHSPELQEKKDQFRVVFLGGSTTFNEGPVEETYPHFVYKILKRYNVDVDYINAGCNGYTSTESLISYHLQLKSLQPDLLIFYHARNDLLLSSNEFYSPNITYLNPLPALNYPSSLHKALSRLSYAYVVFSEIMGIHSVRRALLVNDKERVKVYGYPATVDRYMENIKKGRVFEVFRNNVEALAVLAGQNKTPLVFVSFDFVADKIKSKGIPKDRPLTADEKQLLNDYINRLNAIVKDVSLRYENAYFFDLSGQLSRENFIDGCHLNKNGKQQKAELIADFLLSIKDRIGLSREKYPQI
jgi:lysophospholipase L1-like esterase